MEILKKLHSISCLLFMSRTSPILWSIAIWRCAQSILRVKLQKKLYKTKNREICIFGVLTRHGRIVMELVKMRLLVGVFLLNSVEK